VSDVDELRDAPVGDPVVDGAVLASRGDEAAPAQTRKVVRELGLCDVEPRC
jgi:hypothetical protein